MIWRHSECRLLYKNSLLSLVDSWKSWLLVTISCQFIGYFLIVHSSRPMILEKLVVLFVWFEDPLSVSRKFQITVSSHFRSFLFTTLQHLIFSCSHKHSKHYITCWGMLNRTFVQTLKIFFPESQVWLFRVRRKSGEKYSRSEKSKGVSPLRSVSLLGTG